MGLIPPADVPPHRVLRGAEAVGFDSVSGRWLATGRLQTVTIDDIIAREGPRIPDHTASQKSFRMATIVVSPEELDGIPLSYFDRQARFVAVERDHDCTFAGATGFRATLETALHP